MPKSKIFSYTLLAIAILVAGFFAIFQLLKNDDSIDIEATPPDCLKYDAKTLDSASKNLVGLSEFSLNLSKAVFKCSKEIVLVSEDVSFETLLRASQLASSSRSALLIHRGTLLSVDIDKILDEIKRLSSETTDQIIYIGSQENAIFEGSTLEVTTYEPKDLQKLDREISRRIKNTTNRYKLANPIDTSLTANKQILSLAQFNNQYFSKNNGLDLFSLNENEKSDQLPDQLLSVKIAEASENPNKPVWIFSPTNETHALIALSTVSAIDGHLLFLDPNKDIRKSHHIGNYLYASFPDYSPTNPIQLLATSVKLLFGNWRF